MSTSSGLLPPFAGNWAMFLDIDGTLLELADRPDAVRFDVSLRRLLTDIATATDGALALISGRSVADIDALLAPLALPVAGQHGIERRNSQGRLERHVPAVHGLRNAALRIGEFASMRPGLLFEDKVHSLALHFRQAPQFATAVGEEMRAALDALGPEFTLQEGKMVCEIKHSGRDKGLAIAEFMAEAPFHGRTPVFIGDDLTDEHGFGVVNQLGGHAIKVGDGPSAAPWRLRDTGAVRDWLAALVEYLRHNTAITGDRPC
jgi:trehalose 6-phosphate phosphatase